MKEVNIVECWGDVYCAIAFCERRRNDKFYYGHHRALISAFLNFERCMENPNRARVVARCEAEKMKDLHRERFANESRNLPVDRVKLECR